MKPAMDPTPATDPPLVFSVKDRIATLRLNRPEKFNAFTPDMLDAWAAALQACETRSDVHVIVLTGTGRGFCSGGDVGNMKDRVADTAYSRRRYLAEKVHRIPLLLEALDKPVLVAINGTATGAGLDMALMGDIRIAARSARLGETYVNMGLFAGDGGTWYLPRLVGMSRALELFWTGRLVSADEAERYGMVNQVVDDDQLLPTTYALAEKLAAQPQLAIRLVKRAARQSAAMDLRTHLDMAASHMAFMYSTADHQEAARAFADRRKPDFTGS